MMPRRPNIYEYILILMMVFLVVIMLMKVFRHIG